MEVRICKTGRLRALGVLILWHLRRAIWVIILEYKQYSGTYTHAFLCNIYPYTPFPPYFCYYSYLFGPLPPTNGAFVNMEFAVYEL